MNIIADQPPASDPTVVKIYGENGGIVSAGSPIYVWVQLSDVVPAGRSIDINVKLFPISADGSDLKSTIITEALNVTVISGDLATGAVLRMNSASASANTRIKLETVDDGDAGDEQLELRASEKAIDGSSPSGMITILANPPEPEISFTSMALPRQAEFGVNKPDVDLQYGVRLSNYAPAPKTETRQYLAGRLMRAAQVKVKLSGIDSHVVGSRSYCAFKTAPQNRKVAVPFWLQELGGGTRQEINCADLSELSLSDPGGWTADGQNAYKTDIQATIVMSDPVSNEASGSPWSGNASMNGKLTLDLQLK